MGARCGRNQPDAVPPLTRLDTGITVAMVALAVAVFATHPDWLFPPRLLALLPDAPHGVSSYVDHVQGLFSAGVQAGVARGRSAVSAFAPSVWSVARAVLIR